MNASLVSDDELSVRACGVNMSELGCDELWFDRQRRAEKAGKPWCEHCGRAVDMATAWAVRTVSRGPASVLWGVPADLVVSSLTERWVLFGSTCGPKFMKGRTLLVPAMSVQHEAEWGAK